MLALNVNSNQHLNSIPHGLQYPRKETLLDLLAQMRFCRIENLAILKDNMISIGRKSYIHVSGNSSNSKR